MDGRREPRTAARISSLTAVVLALVLTAVGISVAAGSGTVTPPPTFAFVATSFNFPDALAVGPVAGRLNAPLFITAPDVLDENAAAGLEGVDPEVVVIAGGEVAISKTVEDQIADLLPGATIRRAGGVGRTETAKLVADIIEEFDPAFLPVGATATDSDLLDGLDSADFLRPEDLDGFATEGAVAERVLRTGEFRISTNDWRVPDEDDSNGANAYLQPGTGLVVRLLSGSNAATAVAVAYPDLPVSLFGERIDLVGMELCYDNAGSTLQMFGLRSWAFSAADPESAGGTSATATDNSPAQPTGAACERLDLPEPYTLTPDDRVAAVVQATLPNQDASNLELYRATFILEATG